MTVGTMSSSDMRRLMHGLHVFHLLSAVQHQGIHTTYPSVSPPYNPALFLPAAYKFTSAGISTCALNTSQPIGTSLAVTFSVFDNDASPLSASVTRTLLIVAPCSSGQYYCNGACQQISCAASAALSAAAVTPVITLTSLAAAAFGSSSGGTAMVPYGNVPSFSLQPCSSYGKLRKLHHRMLQHFLQLPNHLNHTRRV